MAKKSKSRGSIIGTVLGNRFVSALVKIVVILALLPVLLIFVYALEGTQPVSTPMLARAVTLQPVERQWKAFEDIAPALSQSVLMSEDGQFCFHNGVDWNELNAVIDDALEGEKTRGASTLAMQTVKNLFLWPHRSFIRKLFEIPYAMIADLVWTKRRMMEIYLNIAEWDEGIYGAEAASQAYFNRPAAELTRQQAALLAVTLPNPRSRNPAKPTPALRKLASVIAQRANQSGAYIKCLE